MTGGTIRGVALFGGAAIYLAACSARFTGPANPPDPYPVHCPGHGSCPIDNECTADGMCRPVAGPWGAARDAGADG